MKTRSILRIALFTFISIVLGLSIYSWNAKNLIGEQLPMPFGFGTAVVLSGSMEPTFSVDDLIVIKEAKEYQVDDIIVFQDTYNLVVHRIVSVYGDQIQTQGDANNVADEPIMLSAVKGKVIFHIPDAGVVVNALKTPAGIIILLVGAVILLEMSYRKEKQEDIDDIEKIKEEIRKLKEE